MRKLNVLLLREIATKLRRMRHEKHYDQGVIVEQTACGTAACVAGWALLLTGKVVAKDVDANTLGRPDLERARRLLGLRQGGSAGGPVHWLFEAGPTPDWPYAIRHRWYSGERRSRVMADLLRSIADGKVEA